MRVAGGGAQIMPQARYLYINMFIHMRIKYVH